MSVCRRPLFGNEVSPSSFATMMAGKAALPWEGTRAPALKRIDNADARLLISGLLRCRACTSDRLRTQNEIHHVMCTDGRGPHQVCTHQRHLQNSK